MTIIEINVAHTVCGVEMNTCSTMLASSLNPKQACESLVRGAAVVVQQVLNASGVKLCSDTSVCKT